MPSRLPASTPGPSRHLGDHLVREKEAHDLSRNAGFAAFQFLGYRTSASAVELVALCDADGLTEDDIVRLRDEFFDLVRRLPHDYGLKPRGRNPNGLLGFVYADGCPEPMARFIARQTRISHAAGTGGVVVSWALDVAARRIHTHDNPVSIFPPVIIAARSVYPGLDYLQSLLGPALMTPSPAGTGNRIERVDRVDRAPNDPARDASAPREKAGASAAVPAGAAGSYDAFIAYAKEDVDVARALAQALDARGVRVWLDDIELQIGDSRQQSIDHGLNSSRFGIVVVSRSFVRTPEALRQFAGMTARAMGEGRKVVLPVWHDITESEVRTFSPPLADTVALPTSSGIPAVAEKIARVFKSSTGVTAMPPQNPMPPAAPPPFPEKAGAAPASQQELIHILFLAADPARSPLDLEKEFERIETNLRMAKDRDRLYLKPVLAGSFDRLSQAMLDDSPTIVHFAGHGTEEGIVLRGEAGEPRVVAIDALAELFSLFQETIHCVVLNACLSEPQARAIREHIPHVIGMRAQIPDATAIAFSTGFYQAIAAGRDVPFAYRMGIVHARDKGDGHVDLITLL